MKISTLFTRHSYSVYSRMTAETINSSEFIERRAHLLKLIAQTLQGDFKNTINLRFKGMNCAKTSSFCCYRIRRPSVPQMCPTFTDNAPIFDICLGLGSHKLNF